MSAAGTTVAHIMVPGMTVTGAIYIKVLKEKLQLHMSVHHCKLFMYDGPVVTSVRLLIISWEIKNIRLLDCSRNWPVKSHWQFVEAVKNKLSGKHPTIQKSLATAMKLSWAKEICYQYGNKFVNKILRCRAPLPPQSCKRTSFWSSNPARDQYLFMKLDLGPKTKFVEWVNIRRTRVARWKFQQKAKQC